MNSAWWCYREAAEVHEHRAGMHILALCYDGGLGVAVDRAQAVVWYEIGAYTRPLFSSTGAVSDTK